MGSELHDQNWEALSQDVLTGMREWRVQHPKATLRDIEEALDERWYRLRARMLHDVALQSSTANWQDSTAAARPTCRACGTPLILRGKRAPTQNCGWPGDHPPAKLRSLPNL
jgi:hypothetical protein